MRRQAFYWTYLVIAIVLTMYGGFSVFYSAAHHKDIPDYGVILLIVGGAMFVVFFILFIISLFQRKKEPKNPKVVEAQTEETIIEEISDVEELKEELESEEEVESEVEIIPVTKSLRDDDDDFEPVVRPRRFGGSAYIKQVGYGPVLRVENENILDMRSNTYYRIEGNMVKRSGGGPVYEISGNRIKEAFGSYLYEISGSNINKTYGGYFASISDSYIQTVDLSERYEISGELNLSQKLAVVALLFGSRL